MYSLCRSELHQRWAPMLDVVLPWEFLDPDNICSIGEGEGGQSDLQLLAAGDSVAWTLTSWWFCSRDDNDHMDG